MIYKTLETTLGPDGRLDLPAEALPTHRVRVMVTMLESIQGSQERIEGKFHQLASRWKKETAHHSAMSQRRKHPAYQAILELGMPALPYIIAELRNRPVLWADALRSITGEDPVPENDARDPVKVAEAWIHWATVRGLVDAAT